MKVSHLYCLDDLQLIGKTEEEVQKQMQAVRKISDGVRMEFGLEKCAKFVLRKRKLVHSQNLLLQFNTEKQKFEQGKAHIYLGTEEYEGMQYRHRKESLKK